MLRIWILLIGITLLGLFLRLINLSPFNLYPDSYQSLLVAQNLKTYGSVVGYLGKNGIIYPAFFSWSHPVYPFLINAITIFTHTMTTAGRLVALLTSVLAIPLAYFFIKRVFSSYSYGLAGALLLAISFNHTVWSGFLMTETTSVFFMLFFLWSFFIGKTNKSFGDPHDIISGTLFGLAVLTRYEYCILLLPVALYLFICNKQLKRLCTILISFFITMVFFFWSFYPFPSTLFVIQDQLGNFIFSATLLFLVVLLFILGFLFIPHALHRKLLTFGKSVVIGFLWLLSLYMVLQGVIGSSFWLFYTDLSALRHFMLHDVLLYYCSLIGFSLLLTKWKTRVLGLFVLVSIVCLFIIYHHIDPDMERYMTHLIPLLLIPASYGLVTAMQKFKFRMLVIIIVVIQMFITFGGMKYSQDPSWYRISYEDKSAAMVKKYTGNTSLLITAYPEPYYYTLHISTQSISDTYPYIYIGNLSKQQKVLIIEDMGMHDDFPRFTKFVDQKMSKEKVASFWVHEKFHYVDQVQNEKYPVEIYKITLGALTKKLKRYHEQ